jgi:fumarate hydratase class II
MTMVAIQVLANNTAIAMAGSQGQFQLNVYKPLMIHAFLQSCRLLTDAATSLRKHLVEGLDVNRARIEEHLRNSLMLVTALAPRIGYDAAAKAAHKAHHENKTLREACLELNLLSGKEFDELVRPERMVSP